MSWDCALVATAAAIDDRPSAFRYPRGVGCGLALFRARGTPLEIRARAGSCGRGWGLPSCLTERASQMPGRAEDLAALGILCTVADARFASRSTPR